MKQNFRINKLRNLDEIIEDSFKFFKNHAKTILKLIWEQNRIALSGLIISYGFYIYFYFGMLNDIFKINNDQLNFDAEMYSLQFILIMASLFIFTIIFMPRFFAGITGYIKFYDENTGTSDLDKVKFFVNQKFWGLIGLTLILIMLFVILIFIVTIFGVALAKLGPAGMFLIFALALPVVLYAIVYLTLVFYVYVFEGTDMRTSLILTVKYLKYRFWFSFLTIFLMGLIISLIGMVLNAPVSIYVMVKMLWMTKNETADQYINGGDILVTILSIISYIGQLILRVLYIIAISWLYFSLKEYHTGEGLSNKIDQIGSDYEDRDN